MKEDVLNTPANGVSRRSFAKGIGFGGAALVGATMLGGTAISGLSSKAFAQSATTDAPTKTDIDILNFALNLEYLEAEFYYVASHGVTLEGAGILPSSAISGPTLPANAKMVPEFAKSDVAYLASALRDDEVAHVLFLRQALGNAAVPKPTIDLSPAAVALTGDKSFVMIAAELEAVGTSAYLGAAGMITSKTVLDAAARILATEAQHTGAMRTEAIRRGFAVPSPDGKDIPANPDSPFFVDKMALTIPRTPQEILAIVKSFFPNGLNGNIK